MNRIKISPLATGEMDNFTPLSGGVAEKAWPSPSVEVEPTTTAVPTTSTQLSFFVPLHYEKNYAYPLIVWLHSEGQNSREIQRAMLDLSLRNYVGVAPESPLTNHKPGKISVKTNPNAGRWAQESASIESAHEAVIAAIDGARSRFHIANHRIFLAGMGSGGTMAFRLAFEHPELFAGVLSVGGPLPNEAPLRTWNRCRELPIFWAHSRCSHDFNESQLCEQLRLLHIAGFTVTLRQYPQKNLVCPKTMADMNHWIMETINSAVGL